MMEAAPRAWVPGRAVAAAAVALVLVAGLGLALDLDLDGDASLRELRQGTRPWDADTDGDGLHDGWERQAGLDPRARDSDGDTLRDDRELALGSDPRSGDSDGDGLADAAEADLPDCDGDGVPAIAEGDGDDDGRLDALEAGPDRCVADADGDGVLDGHEGNAACVHDTDCDDDGLSDGNETDGFDMLDPDSFDSGLADGIVFAFQQAGQPAAPDDDNDGIPDGWEGDDGLIVWGDLRPEAGRRDLLVEFLRVQGPDSARQAGLSFAPAYDAVADAFRIERGVQLRWVETLVNVASETDPALIPQLEDPYYAGVLAKGRHSGNPYVTTVVLNPQHDQSEVLHAGVAPIRGMLAAVDYGTQVTFTFTTGRGDRAPLEPFLESVVRAIDGGAALTIDGFPSAVIADNGEMVLTRDDGLQLRWMPNWFRTNPRIVFSNGQTVPMNLTSVAVATGSLAGTIMHELGHTLGLCHAHDTDCNARFSAADRARQAQSIMSYDNPGNLLHYLDSEWTTVQQYVSCPPDAPVTLVAQGASLQQVLEAKYGYANKDILSVDLRSCNDLTPLQRTFQPGQPPAATYVHPEDLRDPPAGAGGVWLTAGSTLAAAAAVALAAAFGGRRRTRPAPAQETHGSQAPTAPQPGPPGPADAPEPPWPPSGQ